MVKYAYHASKTSACFVQFYLLIGVWVFKIRCAPRRVMFLKLHIEERNKKMRKIRKALSLLLVGVMVMTSLFCGAVTAEAASSTATILTVKPSDIMAGAKWITPLGQDLYILSASAEDKAVYRIDSDIIASWKKTGKLNAKKVTVDSAVASHKSWGTVPNCDFRYGNYALFAYMENSAVYYVAVKYDKSANKITPYYTTQNISGISPSGKLAEYIYEKENNKITLNFISTSGQSTMAYASQFTESGSAKWWGFNRGDSCAITVGFSTSSAGSVAVISDSYSSKTIKSSIPPVTNGVLSGNYFMYTVSPAAAPTDVYVTDTGKSYTLFGKKLSGFKLGGKDYTLASLGERLYGTRAAAAYSDGADSTKYALVNVSNGKILSGKYDFMESRDGGKTYVVKNAKGKWGYINKSGKELGMFNGAGFFMGEGVYAPVIKSGKLWLVDSSLKKVSNTITVDKDSSVSTLGDELYLYDKGDQNYIMTYKGGKSVEKTPDAPEKTVFSAKKVSGGYEFSWNAVKGVTKYEIHYSVDKGKTYTLAGTAGSSKTSATIKLSTDSAKFFKMRSYILFNGKKIYSEWSDAVKVA